MNRTMLMTLRLFAPALAALLAAGVLWVAGSGLADQPMLKSLASEWAVLVEMMLGVALVLSVVSAVCLWRWTEGHALDCPACGHLLGREQQGRFGPYRRCLGCSKNVARVDYEG